MTCFPPPSEGGQIENFEPEERPVSMIHSSSRRFPWSPSCYPPPIEMLSLPPFSSFLTVEVDSNILSFFTPDALSPSPLPLPPAFPILLQTLLCNHTVVLSSCCPKIPFPPMCLSSSCIAYPIVQFLTRANFSSVCPGERLRFSVRRPITSRMFAVATVGGDATHHV
jgi:hypothetical protein